MTFTYLLLVNDEAFPGGVVLVIRVAKAVVSYGLESLEGLSIMETGVVPLRTSLSGGKLAFQLWTGVVKRGCDGVTYQGRMVAW